MRLLNSILVIAAFCLPSFAVTCVAVSPSGSGAATGADWNNTKAGVGGTLTRGDRYYLADGSYSTTSFSTAASGSTTIELRKSQSYDFGRASDGCTNDISAGWNPATMGASQASFNTINSFSTGFWVINGNGALPAPGCGGAWGGSQSWTVSPPTPSDCGIVFNHTGTLAVWLSAGNSDIFQYVEIAGNGVNANQEFEGGSGTGHLLSHMYMHNSGCVFVQDFGNNTTIDHSYFWGTEVNGGSACHGQAEFEIGGTNNGTRTNNVYQDITGTAIWTFAASVGTNDTWLFYNNIVYYSPSGAVTTTNSSSGSCPSNCVTVTGGNNYVLTSGQSIYLGATASSTTTFTVGTVYDSTHLSVTSAPGSQTTNYFSVPFGGTSDAALDCINGNLCTNFTYVQNTVVNCIQHGAFGSSCGVGFADGASGCSLVMENNLFYGNPGAMGLTKCTSMTIAEDYNSFLNTTNFGTGSHDVSVTSGAANPFVNWQFGNFNLVTDGSNYNNRLAIATPTVDIAGNLFTTDRGAYQFQQTIFPPPKLQGSGAVSGSGKIAHQ